jgi:hypothetical protein
MGKGLEIMDGNLKNINSSNLLDYFEYNFF